MTEQKVYTAAEVKQQCNELFRQSLDTGHWFHFRRDYVTSGLLTRTTATFLQDIMNHANKRETKLDEEGYFLCTEAFLIESLAWNTNDQNRQLRILRDKGFIKTRRSKTHDGPRTIFIDYHGIETALQVCLHQNRYERLHQNRYERLHQNRDSNKTTQNTSYSSSEKTKTVADVSATARSSHSSKDLNGSTQEENVSLSFARRLSVLLIKKGLRKSPPNLSSWAREFTRLRQEESDEDIEKVFSWYELHIGEEFVAEAQCGLSFRKKFGKLKQKMLKNAHSVENDDYGTWSNPIPTTIITLLKDKRSHVTNNPNLDWDLIHRIAKQRKCSVGELSVCILLDPNNGEEPVTIKHPNEQQAMMKKMGWTHPK